MGSTHGEREVRDPVCPGCGERHPWDEATVWGLLSIRCPKSPTGYWYFEIEEAAHV